MCRVICFAIAVLAIAPMSMSHAAELVNPDFSGPEFQAIGDTTQDVENHGPPGTWLLTDDGAGPGQDQWRIESEAAVLSQTGSSEAQALIQYVQDNKSMTGTDSLQFDLDWTGIGSDVDLNLYVFGWDGDDPRIDSQNGNVGAGDEFNIEGATRLDGQSGDSPLTLIENGVAQISGLTEGDGPETIDIPIDFGATGFDFVGLSFYGENQDGAFILDNVQFSSNLVIPEPTSIAIWSLIGVGLIGFGYGRYRSTKK